MYVIGKTGVGKSTLLETLTWQDFEAGRGLALVDPHGDFVEYLAEDVGTRSGPCRLPECQRSMAAVRVTAQSTGQA